MRWLVIGVVLAATLWAAWWVAGSIAVRRGVEAAAVQARAEGWTLEWDDLSVSGFPNRFDLTLDAPAAAAPDGAWSATAPFVQAFALSYRPNHLIAVAPPEIRLDGPAGPALLRQDDLRASLVVAPGLDLALRRMIVAGRDLTAEWSGRTLAIGAGQVALREADGTAYDLSIGLERIAPPPDLLSTVGETGLPASVGALTARATATLDRPLDRTLEGPPDIRALEIERLDLRWGPLSVALRGSLTADAAGQAEGTLGLRVEDVDALAEMLEQLIPQGQARLVRGVLSASQGGSADGWIPLTVAGGAVRFGPLTVGRLPPLARG